MERYIGFPPMYSRVWWMLPDFIKELNHYAAVNNFSDQEKSALLLTLIDERAYTSLRALCYPNLPTSKTYSELSELMHSHFIPRRSVCRERIYFYASKQNFAQSATQWCAQVRELSTHCQFGENLESRILDQFIAGLRSTGVINRLSEVPHPLTLQEAVDIASKGKRKKQPSKQNEIEEHQCDDLDNDLEIDMINMFLTSSGS